MFEVSRFGRGSFRRLDFRICPPLLLYSMECILSGAFVYRNGPNYQNGLPELTITCTPEYFSCTILGQSGLKKP